MKKLLLGACTAGLFLSVGCLQEYNYVDPGQNLGLGSSSSSNIAMSDGYLAGDFGSRTGFEGEATRLEGSTDRQYKMSVVNVVREQRGTGAGMVILSTSDITLDELTPGEHRFSYDEASYSRTNIFVNVCSGADDTMFDYDAPAENGTVTITDGANGLRTVEVVTETPTVDPVTGLQTGEMEESSSNFSYQPNRG